MSQHQQHAKYACHNASCLSQRSGLDTATKNIQQTHIVEEPTVTVAQERALRESEACPSTHLAHHELTEWMLLLLLQRNVTVVVAEDVTVAVTEDVTVGVTEDVAVGVTEDVAAVVTQDVTAVVTKDRKHTWGAPG